MTLFRVLSAEEAKKAVRWKAPEVNASAANIIHAKGPVSPLSPSSLQAEAFRNSSQSSLNNARTVTSAPALQAAQTQDKVSHSASAPLDQPTVGMMQTSYDDGYAQGYMEGTKALMESHVVELSALISSIRRETETVEQGLVEQEVYALSIDIARVLLQREIELVPDTLAQLVKSGLDQLPSTSGGVKQVYLHPVDVEIVRRELSQLPEVALVADDRLGRGECRLQSQSSTVHAGVENWLKVMAVELGLLSSSSTSEVESFSPESTN
ncbi:MAG: flagellar biosynthesis/type III secretory pathway protein FliH [Pseudomonadales bacterium]|jgi:flagellar biosynthesis/type III secretory pathway protein FliH